MFERPDTPSQSNKIELEFLKPNKVSLRKPNRPTLVMDLSERHCLLRAATSRKDPTRVTQKVFMSPRLRKVIPRASACQQPALPPIGH